MEPLIPSARRTFIERDNTLSRVAQSVVRFLHVEAAGGVMLMVATATALVWANSPWDDSYRSLWETHIRLAVGDHTFDESLEHVVGDLLMAFFFFVAGMEIKRELVTGSLRDRRAAALPAMGAVGGMLVPALIYLAITAGSEASRGWGIPMATDIAFAMGIVAVLDDRVPHSIKVFLLTLAIVDDIGAIAVIAVFYTGDVEPRWLIAATGVALLVAVLHRIRVTSATLFITLAIAMWMTVYQSGVHATIAGVVLGLLTPARPFQTDVQVEQIVDVLENRPELSPDHVRSTAALITGSISPCDRLIDALHPWTSYLIVPVFALANAGIDISASVITSPSRTFMGVALGLVLGKLSGILLFSALATRLGLGTLPEGARWIELVGAAALAGVGFTVSLFVTGLAFDSQVLRDDAKLATLLASATAAALGAIIFVAAHASVIRSKRGGDNAVTRVD